MKNNLKWFFANTFGLPESDIGEFLFVNKSLSSNYRKFKIKMFYTRRLLSPRHLVYSWEKNHGRTLLNTYFCKQSKRYKLHRLVFSAKSYVLKVVSRVLGSLSHPHTFLRNSNWSTAILVLNAWLGNGKFCSVFIHNQPAGLFAFGFSAEGTMDAICTGISSNSWLCKFWKWGKWITEIPLICLL